MRKRSWLLLAPVLLVASYFARPFYDFVWIGTGRVFDMAAHRIGAPTLSVERQSMIDRHLDQGDEIMAYLDGLRRAVAPPADSPTLDFSNVEAFSRSAENARARLRESLRYPPPGFDVPLTQAVVETVLGEDEFATYRELKIPTLPGVYATGLYLRPKSARADQKLPLVVSAHGRGGAPEPTPDGKLQPMVKSARPGLGCAEAWLCRLAADLRALCQGRGWLRRPLGRSRVAGRNLVACDRDRQDGPGPGRAAETF